MATKVSGWKQSSRARGSNRGGIGGGYEHLDPDWEGKRLRRLRTEYDSLDPQWQEAYLVSLSKLDRSLVLKRDNF